MRSVPRQTETPEHRLAAAVAADGAAAHHAELVALAVRAAACGAPAAACEVLADGQAPDVLRARALFHVLRTLGTGVLRGAALDEVGEPRFPQRVLDAPVGPPHDERPTTGSLAPLPVGK